MKTPIIETVETVTTATAGNDCYTCCGKSWC